MSRFFGFFSEDEFVVFAGGFGKNEGFDVVVWWCSCGGMRGYRGQTTPRCAEIKNTPLL
jgi:hypothetical protein